MDDLTLGRLRVSAVVERAGPTRPTWLLPDATPEALERHWPGPPQGLQALRTLAGL